MTFLKNKVIVVKKRYILIAASIIAVAAIFYVVTSPDIIGSSGYGRVLPIYSVQQEYKVLSLTFNITDSDDGIPEILETLDKYDVRATFFVTGHWLGDNAATAVEITQSGHEIMNLTDDYASLKSMSKSDMISNINACNDKIEAATGIRPALFRAPYGEFDDNIVLAVNSIGMQMIQWDVDIRDLSGEKLAERLDKKVNPGSILILGNSEDSSESLTLAVRSLIQDGYSFSPVSEMIPDSE